LLDHSRVSMNKYVSIFPNEAADRLAIRELGEAHPHCADRRDSGGVFRLGITGGICP
jgi:hypothetical protein